MDQINPCVIFMLQKEKRRTIKSQTCFKPMKMHKSASFAIKNLRTLMAVALFLYGKSRYTATAGFSRSSGFIAEAQTVSLKLQKRV
jgi:hypothetical protein